MRGFKRGITVLVALAFLLALMAPVAFAGSQVKFITAVAPGLVRNGTTAQELGFVKLTNIPSADEVYVNVKLPKGVEFADYDKTQVSGEYSCIVYKADRTSSYMVAELVSAYEDELIAKIPGTELFNGNDPEIRVQFKIDTVNDTVGSAVYITSRADDEIALKVSARGVEEGLIIWDTAAGTGKVEDEDDVIEDEDTEDGDIEDEEPGKPVDEEISESIAVFYIRNSFYEVDGVKVAMDAVPFLNEDDRFMLPVRYAAEALGINNEDISYMRDEDGKEYVSLQKDEQLIELTIGEKVMMVNGEEIALDSPAVIKNGRTYLPLRKVAEALGAVVDYMGEAEVILYLS